jgi:hypothetical protein
MTDRRGLVVSISSAAARDDVYDLIELAFADRADSVKLAKIGEALEESIPRLDPVRFRKDLEHVLAGPNLPQLAAAKVMAQAALDGRPLRAGHEHTQELPADATVPPGGTAPNERSSGRP